jgi:hypothetical protein
MRIDMSWLDASMDSNFLAISYLTLVVSYGRRRKKCKFSSIPLKKGNPIRRLEEKHENISFTD